jgi:hypothetical protein
VPIKKPSRLKDGGLPRCHLGWEGCWHAKVPANKKAFPTLRCNGLTRMSLQFSAISAEKERCLADDKLQPIDSSATFGRACRAGLAADDPASLASVSNLLLRFVVFHVKLWGHCTRKSGTCQARVDDVRFSLGCFWSELQFGRYYDAARAGRPTSKP